MASPDLVKASLRMAMSLVTVPRTSDDGLSLLVELSGKATGEARAPVATMAVMTTNALVKCIVTLEVSIPVFSPMDWIVDLLRLERRLSGKRSCRDFYMAHGGIKVSCLLKSIASLLLHTPPLRMLPSPRR